MMRRGGLHHSKSGSAAVEMALVTPLLLGLFFGSMELGNYLYNEHLLEKAVRDGARYAGRYGFAYYQDSSGSCATPTDTTLINNTKALVRTSLITGGTNRLGGATDAHITIFATCHTTAIDSSSTTQNMSGIYKGLAVGAPVVTVSASVPYRSILGATFGFNPAGLTLNASDQAAVMGI